MSTTRGNVLGRAALPMSTPVGPPWPIANELSRTRLVQRLAARWDRPVTLVVAGAGFGKSTALAQALRANSVAPVGVDAWVGCQPGHEQAEHLAAAILAALGVKPQSEDPVADVVDGLRRQSPLELCVVLDDVHEIPSGSSSAHLLCELVRRLPQNAHLVLAGREPPPIALAHLRAADRLTELGEEDLAFRPDEQAALAARLGKDPGTADRFGGWPALVRLALAVRDDVAVGYAREEVVAQLDPAARRALYALACTGVGDDEIVGRVTGTSVDLAALAEQVPVVTRVGERRFRAHDLWLTALADALPAAEAAQLQLRAIDALVARGELPRAAALAIAQSDWEALGRLAVELVRTSVSVLPVDIASRWLDQVPPDHRAAPELQLLSAAIRAARDFADTEADLLLDAAADAFRDQNDVDAELAAIAVATVAAQSRGDGARLCQLASRAMSVPGGADDPIVRLAARSVAAVVAEMSGDPETALIELGEARLDAAPPALALAANRFRMHCLLLAGQADTAVEVADRHLAAVADPHTQLMPAVARWFAGDPTGIAQLRDVELGLEQFHGSSARDRFVARSCREVILASWGRCDRTEDTDPAPLSNARDAALLANARAARAIVEHDSGAAGSAFAEFLARHPTNNRLGERHLRRFLALGYVLDVRLRQVWDEAHLGPSHEQARSIARLLLATRSGRRPSVENLSPPVVLTVLPLPWAVELACRLHGLGSAQGSALAAWLVDHVGNEARRELRRAATCDDSGYARPAAALLSHLPVEPAERLEIGVLGPLELRVDGAPAERPELRRQRVRELLGVLVVERTITRDRAIDLLWPEHDAEAGGRNLRVTLAHLRHLLEPDRPAGEASFHLRCDATTIALFPSRKLVVDLWELERLAAEAARTRLDGTADRAVELLDAATARWRGRPLSDLDRLGGFEVAIEHAQSLQLASLLTAGELRLTQGAAGEAATLAERALQLDPYLEAAHRVAIAAHGQRHDAARTAAALSRAEQALGDLGVDPEPATRIVMRHAEGTQLAVAAGAAR